MSNQGKVSLSFNQEEESTSIFLLEDLIKEYNNKVIASPPYLKKYPLSLQPLHSLSNPIIRPMTGQEIESMSPWKLEVSDWMRLKKILNNQMTPTGLISNVPNLVAGVSIVEIVNELGLMGKVTYKSVGDKTYVILKGYAKDRTILNGTRYLNTHPEIIRLGLAKVSVRDLYKSGFKSSFFVYGGIKTIEGLHCLLNNSVEPSFFSNVGVDIPKLLITNLVTAATAGAVVTTGFPIAIGAGIVLIVAVGSGILLDLFDQKIGLTEKLSETANIIWINLKKFSESSSACEDKFSMQTNLLNGCPYQRQRLNFEEFPSLYIT